MKKKILAAFLPVLAAAAIVGSGFSAWVFNDKLTNSTTVGGTVSIDPTVDGYTVTASLSSLRLRLDQNSVDEITDNTTGISVFGTGTGEEATEDIVEDLDVTINITHFDASVFDVITFNYTLKFELVDGANCPINKYVDIAADEDFSNFVVSDDDNGNTIGTVKGVLAAQQSQTIKVPLVFYYDDKPDTYDDHYNMVQDLVGEDKSFDFKITLTVNPVDK